jgi:hypothetical protein
MEAIRRKSKDILRMSCGEYRGYSPQSWIFGLSTGEFDIVSYLLHNI